MIRMRHCLCASSCFQLFLTVMVPCDTERWDTKLWFWFCVCTWKCKTSLSVCYLSFWFTSIMVAYASTHSLFSSLSSLSSRCFLTCMSDWIQSSTCSFVAAGRKRCVNKWRQHPFQRVRRADLWRRSWQKTEGFDKQTSLLCDRNEAFSVTQSSNYGSVPIFFLITWPAANTGLVCAPRVHRANQCSENKHRLTF